MYSGKLLQKIAKYALACIFVVFSVFPFVWMVSSSIKPQARMYTIPPQWIPLSPTLEHYRFSLFETSLLRFFFNSLFVASVTTIVSIALAVFAGYGFARSRFRGRDVIAISILFSQMLPAAVIVVPLYVVLLKVQLLDTYPSLIITYLFYTLPLCTWMLRGFFANIPSELEDAAMIDGCTRIGALVKVLIPISAPAIAATATYAFIVAWQEFLFALCFTTSPKVQTLPIGIAGFIGQFNVNWGGVMASSTIASLPILIPFMIFYRRFVEGFAEGAVTG